MTDPDLRLSTGFTRHPKTIQLRRLLGADAVIALIDLWAFARLYRPKGNLGTVTAAEISDAAMWRGDPDAFVDALKSCRLIDLLNDGSMVLHNWRKRQPYAAKSDERSANARRAANIKYSRLSGTHAKRMRPAMPEQNRPRAERSAPSPPPPPAPDPAPDPDPPPKGGAGGSPPRRTVERPDRPHPESTRSGEGSHDPPVPPRNGDRPDLGGGLVGDLARAWPWEPGEEFPSRVLFQIPELVGRDLGLEPGRTLELWTAFLDAGHRKPGNFRAFVEQRIGASEPPPARSPGTPLQPDDGTVPERDGSRVHALVESLRRGATTARLGSQEPTSTAEIGGVVIGSLEEGEQLEDDPLPPAGVECST